jgi:hypothetical protein
MKLRMRTLESSLHAAGSAVDAFAAAKPNHGAWDHCAALLEDAKGLFGDHFLAGGGGGQDAPPPATAPAAAAGGSGANRAPPPPPPDGLRASVALLSGAAANAEGLTPMVYHTPCLDLGLGGFLFRRKHNIDAVFDLCFIFIFFVFAPRVELASIHSTAFACLIA